MKNKKIRLIYLYEFKLGHQATVAAANINKAFGQGSANVRTVQRWFDKFRSGNRSLKDQDGRGRSTSIDNDQLKEFVEANPRTTVRELAVELGVSHMTVARHLDQIGKKKKLDKWVPHRLTENQQSRRLEIASSLLLRHKYEPFLKRLITCDEKWILYDNTRRSGQWLDRDEAPGHFPKQDLHPKKVMVSVWWGMNGIIHFSFLKTGQSITAESYSQELAVAFQKLERKCPSVVNRKGAILLHDNARPHIGKVTQKKLSDLGIEVLPHPPYSPDLSPTDYHLFRHLDNFLRNKKFDDQTAIENAFDDFIQAQDPQFFRDGIEKLVDRWQKCVDADGNYFD
jgi:histone-lysine N-methyltransferase SETMAR